MAVGFFCSKNGGSEWAHCHQGSVTIRDPRELLSVDTYEASNSTQKANYDARLEARGWFYSTVDHTLPEEED